MSPSRSLSPIHPVSPLGSASSGEPQPLEGDIETDVLVVGAGLAGLTSALTAARAGARVVVLDARRKIGARARSEQIDGFTINEGAHALYRKGSAAAVLRNLGIDASGRMPTQRGGTWASTLRDACRPNGAGPGGSTRCRCRGVAPRWSEEQRRALRAFRRIFSKRSALGAEGRSLDDWLDEHVPDASRPLAEVFVRLATYTADPDSLDAAAALEQMRLVPGGVLYLHGGWQSLVDALRSGAVAAGVELRQGRAVGVADAPDGAVTTIAGGAQVRSAVAVLAVGGAGHANSLLGGASSTVDRWAGRARPVLAACLDLATSKVEGPGPSIYGLDQPLYLVNHAGTARLAPPGGGLFHGIWYEPDRTPEAGVAYRMTGSLSEAEDICQECWLRWPEVDHDQVRDAEPFLVTVATRLSIDRQRQAAVRRESYVGPYLPEPLVREPGAGALGVTDTPDPAAAAELADSLTFAFLVLLDELDPVERAVVLLHDVFGYPFAAVAESVERSETAVRQMASRARRRLRDGRSRASRRPSDQQVQELLGPVLSAVSAGDVEVVMAHMAPDVVEMSDGGAAVRAGRRPVVGPERVARLLINLAKRGSHLNIRYAEVNLRPGFVFSDGTEPFLAMSVDFDEQGRVSRLFSVLNPEKLTHLGEEGASPPLD